MSEYRTTKQFIADLSCVLCNDFLGQDARLTYHRLVSLLEQLLLRIRFYRQVIVELIFNTVTGLIAVTLIALFFIPHWSSVFFVFPFITLLYINMLGKSTAKVLKEIDTLRFVATHKLLLDLLLVERCRHRS